MLLPTSPTLARDLSQQIASRNVEKSYLCLARGGAKSFPEREGIIEERLALENGRVRIAKKGEEGTDTKTRWEVIASSVSFFYPTWSLRSGLN
jgi:23S rRNA-/tRNA-specific pseudouridylate synthase